MICVILSEFLIILVIQKEKETLNKRYWVRVKAKMVEEELKCDKTDSLMLF